MNNKQIKRNWIISICLTLVFSFFIGYYASYRINNKEKSKLEIIEDIMENEWYFGIEDEDISTTLTNKMILAMMDYEKDPFTRYLTSLGTLADSFKGIGIQTQVYGKYFIVSDVTSASAIEAGLKINDVILAIDDVDLANETLDELLNLITGKESAVLTIARDNNYLDLIKIECPIEEYSPLTIYSKEYENVAYVRISQFTLDTASYLKSYLSLLNNRYRNLIIDLRDNPGGYISSVRDVADLFMPSGKLVMSTVDKHGNRENVLTQSNSFYTFDEIVVMINGMSASGAEALSAALKYNLEDKVTLYGSKTYGKGSAQKTYYFNDGTYLHYTYALWYTPFGQTIHKQGVTPDEEDINEGVSSISLYNKESKLYDYGEHVENIQLILSKIKKNDTEYYYNKEDIHGIFDLEMKSIVEEFQTNNGLNISGKVDQEFIRYLAKLLYDDEYKFNQDELNRVIGSKFYE